MNFGKALEALKQNKKVARTKWATENIYLFLIDNYGAVEEDYDKYELAYIAICDGTYPDVVKLIRIWYPFHTDLLAEDWIILT